MERIPRSKGVAAVELAILLIPLVLLTLGLMEFGRALYSYNTLVKSARESVRYLSMHTRGTHEAQARCLAVHGNTACSGDPVLPELDTGMVTIDYALAVPTGYGSIDLVSVTIHGYPFATLTSLPVTSLAFGPIGSTMRQGAS